jgi:hypothetical protein
MRFGRYELYRSERDAIDDPSHYMGRLESLASILSGIPWILAGGLTIPLTLGGFYRRHFDVDVAFPVEEFPCVEASMRRAGYYLSTYFPMSLFGAFRCALSAPVRRDGWLVRRRPRKLKFREVRRGAPHLLTSIDALPYRISDGRFVTCDGRFAFPLVEPLVGHRFVTRHGHDIPCLHLHYVGAIKETIVEAKHTLDLQVIASRALPALPVIPRLPTIPALADQPPLTRSIPT